jgi:hypothetical protein
MGILVEEGQDITYPQRPLRDPATTEVPAALAQRNLLAEHPVRVWCARRELPRPALAEATGMV